MKKLFGLLAVLVVALFAVGAQAAVNVNLRIAPGMTCPSVVQGLYEGQLTPDASCQITVTDDHDLRDLLRAGWVVASMPNVATPAGRITTNGTAISASTCQAQPTVTFTGMGTATGACMGSLIAAPGTSWPSVSMTCVVSANTATIYLCNPTAGSVTPAAAAVNVKALY